MNLQQTGPGWLQLTLHAYELATLISAVRWAAEGGEGELNPEARAQLRLVLSTYEAELARAWERNVPRPSQWGQGDRRPEEAAVRKIADCRDYPSESHCSLVITGEEEEVVRAAAEHAASVHGHTDGPELRASLHSTLKDEPSHTSTRYGTVMVGRLHGSPEEIRAEVEQWTRERRVPGYLSNETLVTADGTIVSAVFFDSKEAYLALGRDPAQDTWWRTRMAPLQEGDPTWYDGEWQPVVERATALDEVVEMPEQTRAESRLGAEQVR